MKSTYLFLSLSLFMSACGTQPTKPPAAPEPAPSPTIVPTLTVPPPSAPSTASPTPTNKPAPDAWGSPFGQLSGDFLVIGYLPEYRQLNAEWGKCLTDLVYFSIRPMPDGGLDTSALNTETLRMLRGMRTTYGTRIHISVGGWNRSDNFSPMATRPQSRKKFVRNLLSFCLENDLDGVDFDWEFPENEGELQAYADLLAEVKAAFRPRGLIISIALAPVDSIDLKPYAAVDRIHIMSYDRGSKHATLEQAQQDAESFLSAGAPGEKLILGMPFYGRAMTAPYKDHTYAEIVELYHPSGTIDEIENVYFNGIGTVQRKTCLAKKMGLGGVMIWELGQDTADNTSLLRAIHQAATSECQ